MSLEVSGSVPAVSLSRDNAMWAAAFHAAFANLAGSDLPRDAGLEKAVNVRAFGENAVLFAAGSVDGRVHVVLDGFLTLRYHSPEGSSWVKGFVPPGVPFACVACLDGGAAPFSAHAGVPSVVASVPFQAIDRLANDSIAWQRAMRNAFKVYGQRKEKREMELLMLVAEDRYTRFMEEMPEIACRLKQHEIASYIRVTPVSLSRIRRRLGLTPDANRQRREKPPG